MITKKEIAQGYDKIAEKIYVSEFFYNEVMAIENNWRGAVLDAGCGQGPILQKLAKFLKGNPKSQNLPSRQIPGFRPLKADNSAFNLNFKQIQNPKSEVQNVSNAAITWLVGIDISEKLLEMARKKVPEAEILKADIDKMPFSDNTFDFAVMVDVFQYLCQEHKAHELENYSSSLSRSYQKSEVLDSARTIIDFEIDCGFSRALKEINRVLKPGGKFIVTVPNKNWLLFDEYIKRRKNIQPVEDHFFTFDEMAGLLKKHGFKLEGYRGADCFRYYAPYHKYEMWLAVLFPWIHKKMKKIIFKAVKSQ